MAMQVAQVTVATGGVRFLVEGLVSGHVEMFDCNTTLCGDY